MAKGIIAQKVCVVYWLFDAGCSVPEKDGYVGITHDLKRRLKQHRASGRFVSDFSVSILFSGSRNECVTLEYNLRPHGNIGWNIGQGGAYTKGMLGHKHSGLAKAMMRAKKLGRKHTPEARANMGRPMSDEMKAKLRIINAGRVLTPEQHARMSAAQMGNTKKRGWVAPAETRVKQSIALRGKKRTKETIERMRKASTGNKNCIGFKHTAETRANMSAAHKGYKMPPEQRAKIGAALKGKPKPKGFGLNRKFSEETKAKIAESIRRRHLEDPGFNKGD